jgi:hypothetical protein
MSEIHIPHASELVSHVPEKIVLKSTVDGKEVTGNHRLYSPNNSEERRVYNTILLMRSAYLQLRGFSSADIEAMVDQGAMPSTLVTPHNLDTAITVFNFNQIDPHEAILANAKCLRDARKADRLRDITLPTNQSYQILAAWKAQVSVLLHRVCTLVQRDDDNRAQIQSGVWIDELDSRVS